MASSSSSSPSPSPSFPSSSPLPENQDAQITRQELFAFHNIDRQFFSRLVFTLRRDPSEAMHVAAFWLWLERYNNTARYIAHILTMQDPLFEVLLEETLFCIRVAESDDQAAPACSIVIPIMQSITGMKGISPVFFHENRTLVIHGVSKIVQEVCLRAFEDIFQMLVANRAGPLYNYYQPEPANVAVNVGSRTGTGTGGFMSSGNFTRNLVHGNSVYHPNFGASPSNAKTNFGLVNNPVHNVDFEDAVIEMLGRINLDNYHRPNGAVDDAVIVPTSERTIFVTFSKGYTISEIELREFLSRSFGDIIEVLYMQEVGEAEQPLYARLVVPSLSAMDAVLGVHGKAKFSINGKHVWARKYVRKNSPPSSPT